MADAAISGFVDITGTSTEVASRFVEIAGGDLEQAVMLFFENPDLQHSVDSAPPQPAAAAPAPAASANRRGVREDERGVIHIDSDDDDRDTMTIDDDDDDDDDIEVVNTVARNAQEEEDAAMAQRLQQELFSGNNDGGPGEAGVRSPIRSTHETLVAPLPGWGPGGAGDDLDAEIMDQLSRRRQARSRPNPNPFSQSIWDDPSQGPSAAPTDAGEQGSRAQRLADLFRPPYEIMSRLSWDEARDEGKETKKWLLVNIQDMSDFQCQALNRDLWKDEAIQALVKENFIFLQYDKNDHLARNYLNFYFKTHDNIEHYPHVSIVDPRTGEQVKIWSGKPFPSALEFHAQLAEFLDRYSLSANHKNPVVKAKPKPAQTIDVDRMTEEEMLEMALKNSLASNGGQASRQASRQANVIDPDSLTKSPQPKGRDLPAQSLDDVVGAGAESPTSESDAEESAFSKISGTNAHEEPKHDPATTTRIQFRHASGRIIRRFNTQDRVERVYEWLKAEPMEGKEGVEFELKKMPQGQDLLDSLDKTIEEAGLKQGTVMIEFIE